jgi:hypothetical protein
MQQVLPLSSRLLAQQAAGVGLLQAGQAVADGTRLLQQVLVMKACLQLIATLAANSHQMLQQHMHQLLAVSLVLQQPRCQQALALGLLLVACVM